MTDYMMWNSDDVADLCRVFGEDPNLVQRIDIVVQAGEPVRAVILRLLPTDDGMVVREMVRKVIWNGSCNEC